MNEQNYYRISVKGIVIDNDGRILLSRESDGNWEMLGGGLHHDEDPIAGLKREVHEETGLEIARVSPNPRYFITCKRPGHETYMANIIYEIELESLDFTASDECQELRFFSVEEMKQVDLLPNVQKLVTVLEAEGLMPQSLLAG